MFRRMSEHFYGIPLTEELDTNHKYDLITIYHVLEHMTDPDKKLEHCRSLLADGGQMLISTPSWLGMLENQDGTPFTNDTRNTTQGAFDHLFHKDHINLFSSQSEQNLFRKVGLTIVKENQVCYGQTHIVKAGQPSEINQEDWKTVLEILTQQRLAIESYCSARYQDAINLWPMFPDAHIMLIFKVYGKDPERQKDMLDALPEPIKNHQRILNAKSNWLQQYDKLDEALVLIDQAMQIRPNVELLSRAADIYAQQGKHKKAMELYARVVALHPYMWQDCYNEILWNACQMPTWDENG